MNEEKVREVLDYCYGEAHGTLTYYYPSWVGPFDRLEIYEESLQKIRDKIETLTDDDLGEAKGDA